MLSLKSCQLPFLVILCTIKVWLYEREIDLHAKDDLLMCYIQSPILEVYLLLFQRM